MRTILARALFLMLLLSGAAQLAQAGGIAWRKSLPEAIREAKQTHKMVMIDFYTEWCGYCKKLDAETYADRQVQQMIAQQVVPVKLDAEREGRSAAQKFHVSGFPTIAFVNSAGFAENQIGGFLPAPNFTRAMQAILKNHNDFVQAQSRYQANPNDVASLAQVTMFAAQHEDLPRAQTLLAQLQKADPTNAKGRLSGACNAVGGMLVNSGQTDKALPLFRKSIQIGKVPGEKAQSHMGIALCFLRKKQYKEAMQELDSVVNNPAAPGGMKQQAQQIQAQIRQHGLG